MAYNRNTYEPKERFGRKVGKEIPISVATAIPMEDHIVVESPETDGLWVNIRTVFRNFWSSYSNENRPPIARMMTEWKTELSTIQDLTLNAGLQFTYYLPSYKDIKAHLKTATIKDRSTAKQRLYDNAERLSLGVALDMKKEGLLNLEKCSTVIPGYAGHIMMISHFPTDLLSRRAFNELVLIESNTAAVKEWQDWHSKTGSSSGRVPFGGFALTVYGDGGKMIAPMKPKIRKAVDALAKDRRWSPITTIKKIRSDIALYMDKEWIDILTIVLNGIKT